MATFGRGRRLEDPEGQGPPLGEARLDRRRAGRPLRGHEGDQRRPLRGGRQGAARAAPPGDGDEDGRRARPDEGRGDEARASSPPSSTPSSSPRSTARSTRSSSPSCAPTRRRCPGRRSRRCCEEEYDGEPVSELFAEFETEAFAAASIGQVHRARAARRARRRGQDPVPGDRRGAGGRPAQRRHAGAAGPGGGSRARRQGDRRGAPRADHGGARLRVRGAEPAHLLPRLPRPPVRLRARSRHPALAAPRARHRAGRGDRLRGDQGAAARGAQPLRRDRLPRQLRLDLPPAALQRRPPPRQLHPHATTAGSPSSTSG